MNHLAHTGFFYIRTILLSLLRYSLEKSATILRYML